MIVSLTNYRATCLLYVTLVSCAKSNLFITYKSLLLQKVIGFFSFLPVLIFQFLKPTEKKEWQNAHAVLKIAENHYISYSPALLPSPYPTPAPSHVCKCEVALYCLKPLPASPALSPLTSGFSGRGLSYHLPTGDAGIDSGTFSAFSACNACTLLLSYHPLNYAALSMSSSAFFLPLTSVPSPASCQCLVSPTALFGQKPSPLVQLGSLHMEFAPAPGVPAQGG